MKTGIFSALGILLLLLFTPKAKAQIVSIPDAVFKFKLLQHDPIIDLNGDGEIQISEAEAFTELLDVSYNSGDPGTIYNITGLEAFIYLEEFKASNQEIQFIDLSYNSSLRLFDASGNPYTSLSFLNHPNLEVIQSNFGNLATLDLSGAPNLVFLNAQGNNLLQIDFYSNPALQGVQLDNNPITSYDFSQNPQLKYLYCRNNVISSLDVSNNSMLVAIDCRNNPQLSYINLRNGNNGGLNLTGVGPSCAFYALPELNTVCLDTLNSPLANFIEDHVGHSVTFTEDCYLGSEDPTELMVSVYPNPTSDVLYIHSKTSMSHLTMINLTGSWVMGQSIKGLHFQLNMKTLSSGLYLLYIRSTDNESFFLKVIKI